MTFAKILLIALTAWIGTVWPGAWTALIMLVSLSVLCIALAIDKAEVAKEVPPVAPVTV